MLVLTRKLQEQLRIGDNVTVTVLRVKGNTVRLGIEAPKDVSILRGELPKFDDETVDEAEMTTDGVEPVADGDETGSTAAEASSYSNAASDDDECVPPTEPALSQRGRSLAARVRQRINELPLESENTLLTFEVETLDEAAQHRTGSI